jgi:hypothetical protein
MVKRFMDADIFKKQWFRKMSNDEKVLWMFITSTCSFDGFWEYDDEVIKFYTGFDKEIPQQILDKLGMIKIDNNQYFLLSWVRFQYGTLKNTIRPHRRIIERIKKKDLVEHFPELELAYETY